MKNFIQDLKDMGADVTYESDESEVPKTKSKSKRAKKK